MRYKKHIDFLAPIYISSFFDSRKSASNKEPEISLYGKIKRKLVQALNLFRALTYFKNIKTSYDSLAFVSDRSRRLIDGKYVSGAVDRLIVSSRCLVVETRQINKVKPRDAYSDSVISDSYINLLAYLYKVFFLRRLNYSNDFIDDKLNSNPELKEAFSEKTILKIMKNHYSKFVISRWILKIFKVKSVYITCPYGRFWLIQACNSLNIKVIEIQHGQFSEVHEGYFPKIKYDFSRSIVDTILVYSPYYAKMLEKSIAYNQVEKIPVGNFFIEHYQSKENKVHRCENSFCVSLQNICDEELISIILPFFIENPQFNCFLFPRGRDKGFFDKLSVPRNVYFMWGGNIYEKLIECRYHITMNSTCAYEASALGCYNIVVDPNISSFFTKRVEIMANNLDKSDEHFLLINSTDCFKEKLHGFIKNNHATTSEYWYMKMYSNNIKGLSFK